MNGFFQSIADANRAQCAALGLSACDLYGTPINEAEYETSLNVTLTRLNAMGPLSGMSGRTTPRPAPGPHAVVEYARTPEQAAESMERFAGALGKYYAECRNGWVGD